MSGLSTSQYVSSVMEGFPRYDFSRVKSPEVCQTIINDCKTRGRFETLKSLACFVATAAIAYFAYLAAAALISSYGILATGVTAIALISLFPITLLACVPPIITLTAGAYYWSQANGYADQRSLGEFRRAELLSGKGIIPVNA